MTLHLLAGLLLPAALLLATSQTARAASTCGRPEAVDDGARIAAATDPAAVNVDALCAALQRITTPAANLHGIVVERGGLLQAEAYVDGTDHPGGSWWGRAASFTPDDLHDVRSVTKSVTALLTGIALERGLITSVDTPVLDHFPEHADLKATPKGRITLAHLLGMASGLEWDESGSYVRPGNSETRMRFAFDPERHVLERELVAEPGSVFNYNGGGVALLGEVIARAAGQPLDHFADEVLFKPLDIRRHDWRRDRQGRVTPFGGLRLRPRDMAKIGRLVLDGGRWNDRQIVPAAWVAQMVADRLPATGRLRYGWLWWRGTVDAGAARHPYIAAFGNGGQRIYLVPGLDLVVVVTAGQYNQATSWQAPLRVLQAVVGLTAATR
jgi:CubicO group peptidase (beta-lactamase class C family)